MSGLRLWSGLQACSSDWYFIAIYYLCYPFARYCAKRWNEFSSRKTGYGYRVVGRVRETMKEISIYFLYIYIYIFISAQSNIMFPWHAGSRTSCLSVISGFWLYCRLSSLVLLTKFPQSLVTFLVSSAFSSAYQPPLMAQAWLPTWRPTWSGFLWDIFILIDLSVFAAWAAVLPSLRTWPQGVHNNSAQSWR